MMSHTDGSSLGLAAAGAVTLLGGAIYDYLASSLFHFGFFHVAPVFLVVAMSAASCVAISLRRSSVGFTLLALISVPGLVYMLLQLPWGQSVTDASADRAEPFMRYTYASDVLFCLGYAFQAAACALSVSRR